MFVEAGQFQWSRLKETVRLSVRFLDNVIEANSYPLPFIKEATLNNRRIGLGVMGWAEALIKLEIPYNSEKALEKAEAVMEFIQTAAHEMSRELAAERGVFPNWPYSDWHEAGVELRNATVTTIAPTGTISIIAGTSSGIEPIFAVSYLRRVMGGMELIEVNPLFEQTARDNGFYSGELMKRIAEEGTIAHIEEIPEEVKNIWVCAHDIDYSWHVRMQAAFQRYTDNAVSKTINFPEQAKHDDIRNAYMSAWELGLKGITVYRDASRRSQVLNIKKTDPLQKQSDVASSCPSDTNSENEKIKKYWSPSRAGTADSPSPRGKHPSSIRDLYASDDTKLVEAQAGSGKPCRAPVSGRETAPSSRAMSRVWLF